MKISDLITVDMTNRVESAALQNNFSNPTAAVIFLTSAVGERDKEWRPIHEYAGKKDGDTGDLLYPDLDRLSSVFFNNGGINMVVKRLPMENLTGPADVIGKMINGSSDTEEEDEALKDDIINIILAGETAPGPAVLANAVAEKVDGTNNQERLVLVNIKSDELKEITPADNLYVNVYDTKASDGKPADANNYEVALTAAYVSKINYRNSIIKGLEYTIFNGSKDSLNVMRNVPELNPQFGVNIITELVNRYMIIGGVTASAGRGTPYIAKYFSIVLAQRIKNTLAALLINKLNFENTTYSKISNALTAELDLFINNKLLDTEFEVQEDETVVIETAAGKNIYHTIKQGERLNDGYKVFTLPPSLKDLANKTYSGIYIYYAINNQIRTVHVNGLVLGGM
jgi:hypothetical protein